MHILIIRRVDVSTATIVAASITHSHIALCEMSKVLAVYSINLVFFSTQLKNIRGLGSSRPKKTPKWCVLCVCVLWHGYQPHPIYQILWRSNCSRLYKLNPDPVDLFCWCILLWGSSLLKCQMPIQCKPKEGTWLEHGWVADFSWDSAHIWILLLLLLLVVVVEVVVIIVLWQAWQQSVYQGQTNLVWVQVVEPCFTHSVHVLHGALLWSPHTSA